MFLYFIGEWITYTLMAIALGMDAFSVSLGFGMANIRLRKIFFIGLLVGIFHIIMPFTGMLLGQMISNQFGTFAVYLGGVLLMILGIQMFISSFSNGENHIMLDKFGILVFAVTVSLDSFSIGLSLGMFGVKAIFALFLFGSVSTILTWLGFLLARKVNHLLGAYSEILGGSILFAFGLKLLLA
ncbi:putative Mn2+ efflux pump MntP [Melghiribacillus thermohalophilus]|uniref:Putative manganese efflux pump MntP n=1 Tax=Melghiribacillus thermohalophilus TaxID=1324956 RepID=A0A4R3NGH5_9BACI|nr:manganese efflux pump MntP family protein [Melghiribacillus thermohalophilus]TCT26393.1 putative Mn2+ efflux pump MntP [Melghiribacillus thermohalophilus]